VQPHIDSKKGQVVIVSLLSYCCLDFYRDSGLQDLSVPFTPTLVRLPRECIVSPRVYKRR
jgi:hypothetical protein